MSLPTEDQMLYQVQDHLRHRFGDARVVRASDSVPEDGTAEILIVPREGDEMYVVEIRKEEILPGDREATDVWGDDLR